MEDYSNQKPEQKAVMERLARDKGNRIAILNKDIEKLTQDYDSRLTSRENLEETISELKKGFTAINQEFISQSKKKSVLQAEYLAQLKKNESLFSQEQALKSSVADLSNKLEERNKIAGELKQLRLEEAELVQSIRIKENELRSLQVKTNPLIDREEDLLSREKALSLLSAETKKKQKETADQIELLTALVTQHSEQIKYMEIGGKTMGYYIRGIQKKFDEQGIKVSFIKLLNEIT